MPMASRSRKNRYRSFRASNSRPPSRNMSAIFTRFRPALPILKLGVVTDSQDADGKSIEEKPVPELSREQLETAFKKYVGDFYQIPPSSSDLEARRADRFAGCRWQVDRGKTGTGAFARATRDRLQEICRRFLPDSSQLFRS